MARCQFCGGPAPDNYPTCPRCTSQMVNQVTAQQRHHIPVPQDMVPWRQPKKFNAIGALLVTGILLASGLAANKAYVAVTKAAKNPLGTLLASATGGNTSSVMPKLGVSDSNLLEQLGSNKSELFAAAAQQALPLLDKSAVSSPQNVLQQDAVASPGVLAVQEISKQAPVLAQSAPESPGMPAEVRDWLLHLQACEIARGKMANGQVAQAAMKLGSLQKEQQDEAGSEDSSSKARRYSISVDDNTIKKEWDQLTAQFLSKAPPAECRNLASTYQPVIQETSNMISEIVAALQSADTSPESALRALSALQGQSTSRIDEKAKQADSLMKEVCDKYQSKAWFTIGADFGTGMLGK